MMINFQLEKIHQITSIAGNWKIKQIDSIYQCGSNYSMNKSIRKEDAQVFKFRGKGLLIILKSIWSITICYLLLLLVIVS